MVTQRDIFNAVRRTYGDGMGMQVSKHYLKERSSLSDGNPIYRLRFLEEGTTALPQRRLARANAFVFNKIRYNLVLESSSLVGGEIPITHPNAVAITGVTLANIGLAWNGSMGLKVDNVDVVTGLDLREFLYIPETQARAVDGAASPQWPAIAYSQYSKEVACVELPMVLTLDGGKNNEFLIELPQVSGVDLTSSTSGATLRIEVTLDGYLITGAGDRTMPLGI